MSIWRTLGTGLVLVLGTACDGTSKGSIGATSSGANACGTSSAVLTKQVPLSLGSVPPDLAVGPAWIAHKSESYVSYLYGAIKVTNTGNVGHCFIEAASISYRDGADQELAKDSSYVYGRVKVLSVVSTWTCLDPGDSAYFSLIEKLSYFDVASIHVGNVYYSEGGKQPLADLEATDYTVTGSSVSIVVNNGGTGSAKNAGLVVYGLSASGEFEDWTFGSFPSSGLWGPGEKRTARASLLYDAPCPKLLLVPYYEAAEASSSLSRDNDPLPTAEGTSAADALAVSLTRQRHQAERAKLVLLRR
jgi:hypothetical protein